MIVLDFFFGGLFYAIVASVQMAPIWLPLTFVYLAHYNWRQYLLQKYLASIKWVTVEIRLPREIAKSPQAMEVVLNALNQPRAGSKWKQRFTGQVRLWSSLELVSIGGKVRFIVHMPASFRNQVEAQFYAQYPGVEIKEVEDYTTAVNYLDANTTWEIAGTNLIKARKESFFPIRTYHEFGIGPDKPGVKEEMKTDPMTATLEALGSLPPEHQMWMQILLMSAKTDSAKPPMPLWKTEADEFIKKIYEPGEKFKIISPSDKESTEAIQRAVSKTAFDVGIRVVYAAPKDKYNEAFGGLAASLLKQYGSIHLNSFAPKGSGIDEPYQDYRGIRMIKYKRKIFDAYRKRAYFYPPHDRVPFTMNVEELATIWHLPGAVAATPAIDRIESKASEPPANLPI